MTSTVSRSWSRECIDVVECEARFHRRGAHDFSRILRDDVEYQSALWLPAIVADERLAREPELDRIHDHRKFGEHEMVLAHAEAVHVRRPFDRQSCNAPLLAAVGYAAEAVEALHAEIDDIVVVAASCRVIVRVRCRDLTAEGSAIAEYAERLQRLWLKAHRD